MDGKTNAPIRRSPKQWEWKNAYHSFEHALVGYIVAQQLRGDVVTLYYAFPSDLPADSVQPYYFLGTIEGILSVKDNQERQTQKITFRNVH